MIHSKIQLERLGIRICPKTQYPYKPIQFIGITFTITWICAFFLAFQNWFQYDTVIGSIVLMAVSFIESASPLLAALFLLRRPLFQKKYNTIYFWIQTNFLSYSMVLFLFFRIKNLNVPIGTFMVAWLGQIITGGSFLFYIITTTATAFTLTAIHKLTGSILICTLFHGWQNAIVVIIQTDMMHPEFLTMFLAQTILSMFLCVKPLAVTREPQWL